MCGISGEFRFDGQAPKQEILLAMQNALIRRGPDAAGLVIEQNCGFAHRRLSIIDLSDNAKQPMRDDSNGNILVFNGTIYNYQELRQQLMQLGHIFKSSGDSEVILKAYAEWGSECVNHLDGMFAFAIFTRQKLFLVRDRLGIKPLYYCLTAKFLRFASSLPALLAADRADKDTKIDSQIDWQALQFQFTLHGVVPAPYTIIKGIRKFPPAHSAICSSIGNIHEKKYWQSHTISDAKLSDAAMLEIVEKEMQQAVASHITAADVPVGVLLSGGLDSSLLLAYMQQHRQNQGIDNRIHTFSIGFEDQPEEKGDEFYYSDLVAEHFATNHQQYRMSNSEVLNRLPEAIAMMNEPMFSQDNISFYLLGEQVKKQVKVVLSGQGADEVFAGYYWYPLMQAASGSAVDKFANNYFDRDAREWKEMLTSEAYQPCFSDGDIPRLWLADFFTQEPEASFLDRVFALEISSLVVDDPVKRIDNMMMAWGVEARVPFLDHHLVEAALQLPASFKLRSEGKYPLKALARQLLPAEVIDRPKGYFPTPAIKYLRGGFLQFIEEIVNSPSFRQRGIFSQQYINKLLNDPLGNFTRLQGNKLWHIAVFEAWLQTYQL